MHDALNVTLILLASAVGVVVVFRRLAIPAIIGYLLVGALVGPHALGLVSASDDQRNIAECGVVPLRSYVGSDHGWPQLTAMRRVGLFFVEKKVAAVTAIG